MGRKKGFRILIVVAAVLALLAAAAGGLWLYTKLAPEQAAQRYAAAVDRFLFTKTIHDFPGHLVDNLDESETENFVVYAKGVRRVESGNGANILVSIDENAESCIIELPNEQVTSLKAGDVFFMDPSEQCISGFAIKVERITLEQNRAIIEGTAPELRELLEYADVDMDLSLRQVYVEETDVPYTLSWQAPVDEQALWDSQSRQEFTAGLEQLDYPAVDGLWEQRAQQQSSGSAQAQNPGANTAGTLSNLPEQPSELRKVAGRGSVVEKPEDGVDDSVSSQFNVAMRLERIFGPVYASGEMGVRVNNIRVTYKFHPWLLNVQSSIRMDAHPYFDGKLGLQVSGEWEVFGFPTVYFPVAGPLGAFWSFTPLAQLSGGVYGRIAFAADTNMTVEMTQILPSGFPIIQGHETSPSNVAFRVAFTDVEGQLQVNLLRAMGGVGVPKIAELRAQCAGGFVIDASLETKLGMQDDGTMHICDACVDGDTDWIAELKAGTTRQYGKISDSLFLTLAEHRGDLFEFYVSFRKGDIKTKVECDIGPCPYKGVPYTVQVASTIQNEDIPRSNFVVKAENEDGDVKWELTDEEGIARLMLQQGHYELTVEHGLYEYTEQITVSEDHFGDLTWLNKDETRIDKTVEVDLDPEVYVVLCHYKGGGNGDGNPTRLLNNILGNTPYKLIVADSPMSEYDMAVSLRNNGAVPGDIVVDIWYHEADKTVIKGDRWRNSGFILGFYHVNIGRLLYEYNGVDDSGEEFDADTRIYWWEKSNSNYFGNNTYINGFNYHDDYNRSDDPPPEINGVEQRCEVNLTLTSGPRYDAAYCVLPAEQQQAQQWYNHPMGNPGFWGLYNQIGSLRSSLVSRATMYSNYVPAMLNHQDFKLLFP